MKQSHALTLRALVALGSATLFALEPLVARALLPAVGGSFVVWAVVVTFFQAALVVSYLLAAQVFGRWPWAHPFAALAVACLPVAPAPSSGEPMVLFASLVTSVGPIAVVLGATSLVAQRAWLDRTRATDDGSARARGLEALGLYAFSNVAALVGLALGPALENLVGMRTQLLAARMLAAAVGVAGAIAYALLRPRPHVVALRPSRALLRPFVLAFGLSMWLSAVTNVLTIDAGALPILWTLPLALFLVAFWVGFRGIAPRPLLRTSPHIAVLGLFFFAGGSTHAAVELAIQLVVFFAIALTTVDQLHRDVPPEPELFSFYAVLALGGALGGAFVAFAAPFLFSGRFGAAALFEYPLALFVLGVALASAHVGALRQFWRSAARIPIMLMAALLLVVGAKFASGRGRDRRAEVVRAARGDYSIYRVVDNQTTHGPVRNLVSAGTTHGRQRSNDARVAPVAYYDVMGPIGAVIAARRLQSTVHRWAVIGLGAGVLAAYDLEVDRLDFFELDPLVEDIARTNFRFLEEARGQVTVTIGDARVALRGDDAVYDTVMVDAFSGDAVPIHLLTVEAMEELRGRLVPGGLLVYHLSNRVYDLVPRVVAAARELELDVRPISQTDHLRPLQDPSEIVLVGDASTLASLDPTIDRFEHELGEPRVVPFRDDIGGMTGALRFFTRLGGVEGLSTRR